MKTLAERMCHEAIASSANAQEALLSLCDLVILLREVDYAGDAGSLARDEFDEIYRPFLQTLVGELNQTICSECSKFGNDVSTFWERTIKLCQQ